MRSRVHKGSFSIFAYQRGLPLKSNVAFAKTVEPENRDLLEFEQEIQAKEMTIPSTIGYEKKINPFMRSGVDSLMKRVSGKDSIETLGKIRAMKDQF